MPRALVVGAGIGGLFFVSLMRKLAEAADWSIEVVERSAKFEPLGAGIVIHPNGMSALAQRGLDTVCRRRGTQLRRIELTRGDEKLNLALEEIWDGADQPTVAIGRPELHDLLVHAAFEDAPDAIRLVMGRSAVKAECADGASVVYFNDGSRCEYDLLVAADGVHSAIRRSVVPGAAAISTGLLYFRFLVENVIGVNDDCWVTVEEPDASWGFIPLGQGRLHCFVQVRKEVSPDGLPEDYLNQNFVQRDDRIARCLAAASHGVEMHFAYMVRPVVWGTDNCALMGDAAHAIAPTLSEGGSLAMEDALTLASALDAFPSVPSALAHYRHTRHDRVTWAHRIALAQVNATRRPFRGFQMDPIVAVQHMRHMYQPLCRRI